MCNNQAGQSASLLCMRHLCPQGSLIMISMKTHDLAAYVDGPPLPLGEQLCGVQQLQVFRPLSPLWTPLLPLRCPH